MNRQEGSVEAARNGHRTCAARANWIFTHEVPSTRIVMATCFTFDGSTGNLSVSNLSIGAYLQADQRLGLHEPPPARTVSHRSRFHRLVLIGATAPARGPTESRVRCGQCLRSTTIYSLGWREGICGEVGSLATESVPQILNPFWCEWFTTR